MPKKRKKMAQISLRIDADLKEAAERRQPKIIARSRLWSNSFSPVTFGGGTF
jgi:hypothetical protein